MFSSQNSTLIANYETLILKWNFETGKSLGVPYCEYVTRGIPKTRVFGVRTSQ
jgi:hypothetical protein